MDVRKIVYINLFNLIRISKVFIVIFALIYSSNGVILRCNFGNVAWVMIGFQYGCIATVEGQRNVPNVEEVNGVHGAGKSDSNVKVLTVIDDQLSRIPDGIDNFFAYLIGLQWFRGNLMTIYADDLRPFPDLQVIRLENNKLFALDSDLFRYTPKLQFIGLGNNLLQHIGLNMLTDLNNLAGVYFQKNPCIETNAGTPDAIQELKRHLPQRCPPLALTDPPTTTISTTTQDSGECSYGCVTKIVSLEREMLSLIDGLRREVVELTEAKARQEVLNAYHGAKILELEKQMRERNPCSCIM